MHLIRICYLTPLVGKMLLPCLAVYNLWGRFGLAWIRRQIRHGDYLYFLNYNYNRLKFE